MLACPEESVVFDIMGTPFIPPALRSDEAEPSGIYKR